MLVKGATGDMCCFVGRYYNNQIYVTGEAFDFSSVVWYNRDFLFSLPKWHYMSLVPDIHVTFNQVHVFVSMRRSVNTFVVVYLNTQ